MSHRINLKRSFLAAALCLAPLFAKSDDSIWEANYQRGRAEFDAGKYTQAIPLLKQALEQARASSWTDFRFVESAYTLALAHQVLGQASEAEPLYLEAKATVEQMGAAGRPLLGFVVESLGTLRFDQGRWKESELLHHQAIALCTETQGPNHICTLTAQRSLGELMRTTGSFAEAERTFEPLIANLRRMPSPPQEFLAGSLASLATLYLAEYRFDNAESLLRESLDVVSKSGIAGAVLADTLLDLGQLYRLEHDGVRAEPLLRKALAIYEAGCDPRQAAALNELGLLAIREKKFAVARDYLNRSLRVYQKLSGTAALVPGRVKAALAEAFLGERNVQQARSLIHEALSTEREALGDQHCEYARQLIVAAQVEQAAHRAGEADTYYRQALTIYRRTFSNDQPERSGAERNYAIFIQSLRK